MRYLFLGTSIILAGCDCKTAEVKVVREPMHLSRAAKIVQSMEPVIDQRWQQPVCFLALETPPVVVRVPCRTLWGMKTTEDRTNRVVTHQTLYPPQSRPAEKIPDPTVEDITRDAQTSD